MTPLAERLRWTAVALTLAVAAFVIAWLLTPQVSVVRALLAALVAAPLLIALPGLLGGRRRTYAWMTLAIVPYLALALMEVIANPALRVWAFIGVMTAFALFVVLIARLRLLVGSTSVEHP